MLNLDPKHWFKKRDAYMQAARDCQAALIRKGGYWQLSPDSDLVEKAVSIWILKARQFHEIAMRRRPIVENFIAIIGPSCSSGPLYAKENPLHPAMPPLPTAVNDRG